MQRQYILCDPDKCTGCRICEFACSAVKEGMFHLELSRIRVAQPKPDLAMGIACRFCENAPCITSCPRDALSFGQDSDVLKIDKVRCTGCGWCIEACDFGAMILDRKTKAVVFCDLCPDLPEPRCVEMCPKDALSLSNTEVVSQRARHKVVMSQHPG